jgi:hypothetical protein
VAELERVANPMNRLWIAGAWLLVAESSEACSCRDVPLQVHFRHSSAVFSGRVLAAGDSRERGYNGMLATVQVTEAWKGTRRGQVVTVATGYGGGDCGVHFARGSSVPRPCEARAQEEMANHFDL